MFVVKECVRDSLVQSVHVCMRVEQVLITTWLVIPVVQAVLIIPPLKPQVTRYIHTLFFKTGQNISKWGKIGSE